MIYLILRWDAEELKWIILHYSHNWDDAEKQYEIMQKRWGDVQLFLDARAMQFHDAMIKAKELAAAIRARKAAK